MARRKRKREVRRDTASSAGEFTSNSRWWMVAALCLLVGMTIFVYWPSMHGGFLWDDDSHITRAELRSVQGLYRIWFEVGATQQYYPLLHSAFWLQYKLWGEETFGYHMVNVLLHATSACLVFFIVRQLKLPGAYLAAAIFAIHPVYVESVAWITELKNTLSGVCYLAAMLLYLHFDASRRRSTYLLASICFLLGLLSKTVTATLPAALLVIFWWQRGRLEFKRDVLPLMPWFILGAASGLFTAWFEHRWIGASGQDFTLTATERLLLSGRVVWFYLSKLLWPTNLIFIYPRWEVDSAVWWQWLFPIGAMALVAGSWMLRKHTRGPLAALLFFGGTLFPVLGFFNVFPFLYSFVADHFQYLASLGIVVFFASLVAQGVGRSTSELRMLGVVGCGILLATLATLTWQQNHQYRDVVQLYEATLRKNPACWMAHNNLGLILYEAGRKSEARKHYEEALRLRPSNARAHHNFANLLADAREPENAFQHYQEAIRLKPDQSEFRFSYGNALMQSGDTSQAMDCYRRAIALNPNFSNAHNNLAVALANSGDIEEAIPHFEKSLQINPVNAEAHNNLGDILRRTGQHQAAIDHFHQALELRPDFANVFDNLSLAYAELGRYADAVAAGEKGLNLARSQRNAGLVRIIESRLASHRDQLNRDLPKSSRGSVGDP